MYESHPRLKEPDDPDAPVWHYTSYAAYLELLRSHRLHFTRLDKLRDPSEGRFVEPDDFTALPDPERARVRSMLAPERDRYAVSCWCMARVESIAYWERYGAHFGVAVRSTLSRLRTAVHGDPAVVVHLAVTNYDSDPRPKAGEKLNQFRWVVSKLPAYEDEHELRAVIWSMETKKGGDLLRPNQFEEPWPEVGWGVQVDLETLIEEVWVGPPWETWFHENVKATTTALGFDAGRVRRSALMDRPDEEHARTRPQLDSHRVGV